MFMPPRIVIASAIVEVGTDSLGGTATAAVGATLLAPKVGDTKNHAWCMMSVFAAKEWRSAGRIRE
jgi:hypothetical protein